MRQTSFDLRWVAEPS